jgi:hypothetical protein
VILPEEKLEITNSLRSGLETLIQATHGVTVESARRKPDAGTWSILECMEHVAVAEEHMLAQIKSASKADIPFLNKGREALIRKRGADRAHKVEAPEVAKPIGRFQTLDQASQHFLTFRRMTIEFVEKCDSDLRELITTHPIVGQVNCYEMLLIMSAHPFRHAEQIKEIRARSA